MTKASSEINVFLKQHGSIPGDAGSFNRAAELRGELRDLREGRKLTVKALTQKNLEKALKNESVTDELKNEIDELEKELAEFTNQIIELQGKQ